MNKQKSLYIQPLAAMILLAAGVFILDLQLPLGVAGGVPYVAVILISLWLPKQNHTIVTAIACTSLTILGFFYSEAGSALWIVLTNRFFALFAIWVTAVLTLRRKQAEEKLRRSENQFRIIFESSPIGMTMVNAEGQFIRINQAFQEMLGYSEHELLAMNFVDLINPDEVEESLRLFAELKARLRQIIQLERHYRRKDQTSICVHTTVFDIRNANGEFLNTVAMVQNITKRKESERQILTALAEKETLLREIHHRVKNNLQVISSLLGLQANLVQNNQAYEAFLNSQHRIRAMALVHERLYLSDNLAKVALKDYVQKLADTLVNTYALKYHKIILKVDVKDIYLNIDKTISCGLVINELVSNSLKHAFPGGQEGKIDIACQQNQNGRYVLIISDNGIGLPADKNPDKEPSLGLKLVTTLVDQLEGEIKIVSPPGTTTIIEFSA